jgi:hypothetical protein
MKRKFGILEDNYQNDQRMEVLSSINQLVNNW